MRGTRTEILGTGNSFHQSLTWQTQGIDRIEIEQKFSLFASQFSEHLTKKSVKT